ncbi:unnamed protein product [Caenorhabditis sp. 36 PRJEB53466]|nr:unnamed protein product [Caenorhabditis sp. 36 PRJEB53466]
MVKLQNNQERPVPTSYTRVNNKPKELVNQPRVMESGEAQAKPRKRRFCDEPFYMPMQTEETTQNMNTENNEEASAAQTAPMDVDTEEKPADEDWLEELYAEPVEEDFNNGITAYLRLFDSVCLKPEEIRQLTPDVQICLKMAESDYEATEHGYRTFSRAVYLLASLFVHKTPMLGFGSEFKYLRKMDAEIMGPLIFVLARIKYPAAHFGHMRHVKTLLESLGVNHPANVLVSWVLNEMKWMGRQGRSIYNVPRRIDNGPEWIDAPFFYENMYERQHMELDMPTKTLLVLYREHVVGLPDLSFNRIKAHLIRRKRAELTRNHWKEY